MRQIAAGNVEPDRRGAGGEEQRAVMMPAAVREPDLTSLGINRRSVGAEL